MSDKRAELTVNFKIDDSGESSANSKLLKTPTIKNRRMSSFASSMDFLKNRRMTKVDLSDLSGEEDKIKMENTYRMTPNEGTRFETCKVTNEINKILENYIGDMKYDPERCSKLCVDLSALIKNEIKSMNIPRYKIICSVFIGQLKNQGFEAASLSVWDAKTDNYSCGVYKNKSLFAIGMVHGVYFE